MIYAAYKILLA